MIRYCYTVVLTDLDNLSLFTRSPLLCRILIYVLLYVNGLVFRLRPPGRIIIILYCNCRKWLENCIFKRRTRPSLECDQYWNSYIRPKDNHTLFFENNTIGNAVVIVSYARVIPSNNFVGGLKRTRKICVINILGYARTK